MDNTLQSSQNTNQEISNQYTSPHPPKRKFWILVTSVLFCSILVGVLTFLFKPSLATENEVQEKVQTVLHIPTSSPTPFPFRELTIPYLRERAYKSSLTERTLAYDAGAYTAYITNYNSDGLKINGLLTIPKIQQPQQGYPAVIFIHGYIPPAEYRTTEKYYDYVDYIARNGFVVFKIDLRGHGDSEGEAGGGYYGSDYIIDTLNAYAALQNSDFVNPKGIGLWGHSMAGNIVMRSIAARPEIPGAVIWAGAVYSYVDQRKYGISDASYQAPSNTSERQRRRRELFEKVGSPSAESKFWQQVAPIYFLEDLKGEIEIHHAQDDDVVNIGYSRDLIELLDKTSVPHALYEYSSGGHNISGQSFDTAMERTVEFYEKTLK